MWKLIAQIILALLGCSTDVFSQPGITTVDKPFVINGWHLNCRGNIIQIDSADKEMGTVVLEGKGSVIQNCIIVYNYTGPEIDSRTVHVDEEGPHAIYVNGAEDFSIINCESVASHGDGLYVGNLDQSLPPARNGTVEGNKFKGGRHGFTLVDVVDITMTGNEYESLDKYSTYGDGLIEQANTNDVLQGIKIINGVFKSGGHKHNLAIQLWKNRKEWDIELHDPIFVDRNDAPRAGRMELFRPLEFHCKGSKAPGTFKFFVNDSLVGGRIRRCDLTLPE